MSNRNTVTPEQKNNSDIQPIDAVSPHTIRQTSVSGSLRMDLINHYQELLKKGNGFNNGNDDPELTTKELLLYKSLILILEDLKNFR